MKRPVCVFSLQDKNLYAQLEEALRDIEIDVHFVSTETELLECQERSEVFACFVDLRIFPEVQGLFRQRSSDHQPFWVIVSDRLPTHRSQSLLSLGISEILNVPVHPISYKSWARALLAKFVQKFNMPEEVVLPAGMLRPKNKPLIQKKSMALAEGRVFIPGSQEFDTAWKVHVERTDRRESAWISRCEDFASSPMHTGVFGNKRVDPAHLKVFEIAGEELGKNSYLFFEIIDPLIINNYFSEAVEQLVRAHFWSGNRWNQQSYFKGWDSASHEMECHYPSKYNMAMFQNELLQLKGRALYVTYNLNRARMFLKVDSSVVRCADLSFFLKIPSSIFQVQRREFYRICFSEQGALPVRLYSKDSQPLLVNVINLSAGGLMVAMSLEDYERLPHFSEAIQTQLDIYEKTIWCTVRIQRKSLDAQKKQIFLGLQLEDIQPEDHDGIHLFVMEESYAYLKKFVVSENS